MQDEKQFEQLMLQYTQLRNGAEDISRMLDNEDYDSAITVIKGREQLFLSCKCIRNYLELTPVQQKELDELLDELRALENSNMEKLKKSMLEVQAELKQSQISQKIQKAYDADVDLNGSIINIQD